MRVVKGVLIGVMLAAAVAVLVRGPRGTADVAPGVVVVDYWEKWTGPEGRQIASVVDDFNATVGRAKGIYVRLVTTSNIDRKTLVATAAGVPPDVAGMWQAQLVQFAALDALTPLDAMAAARGITADTYKRVYWDACRWDGHLYALVSTPATVALIYNRAAFRASAAKLRAAGCDPDRPPRTLAEFDRYAAALDERDRSGRLVRAGMLPAASWYLLQTPLWFGGDVWDARAKRFTLTSPAVVDTFKWAQAYSRRMGAAAASDFKTGMGNFDSPQNPFLAGTEVMQQQGPWMANFILTYKPTMFGVPTQAAYDTRVPAARRRAACDWAAAPFPSARPGLAGVTYADFDTLVIPKGARHPAEAFEFMAYLTTQSVMEHLCDLHGKNSPLRRVSPGFLEHHKNPFIDVWDGLAAGPNARGIPQVPIWPQASDELTALAQQLVLQPDLPPEPELAALQGRLQAAYDTFVDRQRARRGSAER